jgi:polyhydroxyalkanoate synthesis regulator phasin
MKGPDRHELISEWTTRSRLGSAEASRHLVDLLDEARRRRGDVQQLVQQGAQQALLTVAAATRRQIEELEHGLAALSQKLKVLERHAARRRAPVRRRRAAAVARPRRGSPRAVTTPRKVA